MHVTTTLFISCVSAEFAEYRAYLLEHLDFMQVRIETQERFAKELDGDPVLLELDDYIRGCDAVVHLVGTQGGRMASAANRNALTNRYPQLTTKLGLKAEILDSLTYTQWEAWLALLHGKKLIIARAKSHVAVAAAASGGLSQADHLDCLKTLQSRYPQLDFENPSELAISLLKFHLRNLPSQIKQLIREEEKRRDRFGKGMIDKLKARIAQLPKASRAQRNDYVIATWVQITGQLPSDFVDGRDPISATVDLLAERDRPLDLRALVRRPLVGCAPEAQTPAVQQLQKWLDDALAHCEADNEMLDGYMADAESEWDRSRAEPPRPRIELGWRRSPASVDAMDRLAFIRWGRCRATLPALHQTQGHWEHLVSEAIQTIVDLSMTHWPIERVEVSVEKAQLNHPWEYDANGEIHGLPVVLRLKRNPFKSKGRCDLPPSMKRQMIACALADSTAFQPLPQTTGAFFASWSPTAVATEAALHNAVDVVGIGLWTRGDYDPAFVTALLDEIDDMPLEQLPDWVHGQRALATPSEPWSQICLLYDCKSLPQFEAASDRYTAQHQRRAVMGLQ